MPVTLKQLFHARALKEHGNFRRAAAAQNLTQPAFSRSIQMLEKSLGVSLFDRQADGVSPTVYGEALLRRAKNVFAETSELEREIQLLRGLGAGRLSVAMGIYSADVSGNRAMAELLREHPRLRCHIAVSDWPTVANLVLSRRADIGFAEISEARRDERLQVESTGQHEVVLFCRLGHPLVGIRNLSKSDFDTFPLATVRLPPRVAALFPGIADVDEESGALIPSLELDDMDTMRTLVATSDAFGMVSLVQIESSLRRGEFAVLGFREPWMRLEQGLFFLRNRMLSPSAERFMQLVRSAEKDVARKNQELMRQWYLGH
jgi:DNA-binding transcriptional LysR family regulator